MVIDPANYLWSSYRAHAFGINVKMWTPHPEYLVLGSTEVSRMAAYRRLFEEELEKDTISEIRSAANRGLVLGNKRFRTEVERLTGQRQHQL